MLLAGIVLGLFLGLAAGGRLDNLLAVRLRWTLVIFLAVVLRLGTEAALQRNIGLADEYRALLLAVAYATLVVGLWVNRGHSGIGLAMAGTVLNATAILVNGGYMPVWDRALEAAQLTPADILSPLHFLVSADDPIAFLRVAGPLGDVIPIPLPVLRNVLSVGDVILAFGVAVFVFASLLEAPAPEPAPRPAAPGGVAVATGRGRRGRVRPATGLGAGFAETMALERPVVLGGSAAGIGVPVPAIVAEGAAAREVEPGGLVARALRHPYVRLARNGSFVALWTGQVISLFGDRIHQIALAFLVLGETESALAVGLTFFAATLPNLVVGPVAGALVDRWDQRRVMVVSDLLRAAIVMVVPIAAAANILLVYPLVFALTTVSIFFRPARTSAIPRIVHEDELVAANSAVWLADSIADVLGYPLATLFVTFLGSALVVAFFVDAVSYLASALLIVTMTIPALARVAAAAAPGIGGLRSELVEGWRFLRGEPVLLANTAQAVVGQFAIGITIGLMAVYAQDVLVSERFGPEARYGFIETAIGIGNLVGGFVIGLIGTRIARGRMVIAGYVGYGAGVAGLALTGHLGVALGLAAGTGIANMVFVIPTQTLFMERTPADMIGRVISFRFSAVFGSMTLAMAVGGILGEAFGPAPVFGVFGVITVLAGLAGLLSRPLREA